MDKKKRKKRKCAFNFFRQAKNGRCITVSAHKKCLTAQHIHRSILTNERWRVATMCPFTQHTLILLQLEHKEDLIVWAQGALLGRSWWKLAQEIQACTRTVGYTTSSFRIATLLDGAPRCPD